MKLRAKVKIDNKKWNSIKRNLTRQKGRAVDVGWWGGKSHPRTKVSIAQIAQWNEEGHYNGGAYEGTYTPPRPFIRSSLLPFLKRKLVTTYIGSVESIADGKSTWTALNNLMSKDAKEALEKAIIGWNSPPNSPRTIELKGFNEPLIETGALLDNIRTRIARLGGGDV